MTGLGIFLLFIKRVNKIAERITKIKVSEVELELNAVENLLGVGDDSIQSRQKFGLLDLARRSFEDINEVLNGQVNQIDNFTATQLGTLIPERQMALLYIKNKNIRPELLSAFLQLCVKKIDLDSDKKMTSSEIIKVIGLCYQVLYELKRIDKLE